ncbi:hypothetical protein KSP39_PZI013438 [Platanthera zijinensis]
MGQHTAKSPIPISNLTEPGGGKVGRTEGEASGGIPSPATIGGIDGSGIGGRSSGGGGRFFFSGDIKEEEADRPFFSSGGFGRGQAQRRRAVSSPATSRKERERRHRSCGGRPALGRGLFFSGDFGRARSWAIQISSPATSKIRRRQRSRVFYSGG